MALEHFGHALDATRKPFHGLRAVMRQHDVDEAQQIQPHGFSSDDRRMLLDNAARFELSEALLKTRRGKMKPARQFRARRTGVLLQVREQAPVEVVHAEPGPVLVRRHGSMLPGLPGRTPRHGRLV